MIGLWLLLGIGTRLLIHWPDFSAITSLCLLCSRVFSKTLSFAIMLTILFLSDICLHILFHYPIVGAWTLFSYSGWLAIIFLGFLLSKNFTMLRAINFSLMGSVFFWIWTNFGTWCTTHLYPHTLLGLSECYVAALPFLEYSILGSAVWMMGLIWMLQLEAGKISTRTKYADRNSNCYRSN